MEEEKKGEWVKVPGYPRYEANLARREVRNARTGRKLKKRPKHRKTECVFLYDGTRTRLYTLNNLLFAVQEGVPPHALPKNTHTELRGGRYAAVLYEDYMRAVNIVRRTEKGRMDPMEILRRERMELEALEKFYKDGDGSSLSVLLDEARKKASKMLVREELVYGKRRADEFAAMASDTVLEMIAARRPVTNLRKYVAKVSRNLVRKVRAMRKRERPYDEGRAGHNKEE